jgi:hypothetical protein
MQMQQSLSRWFKKSIRPLAAVKDEMTLAQLPEHFDVHPLRQNADATGIFLNRHHIRRQPNRWPIESVQLLTGQQCGEILTEYINSVLSAELYTACLTAEEVLLAPTGS